MNFFPGKVVTKIEYCGVLGIRGKTQEYFRKILIVGVMNCLLVIFYVIIMLEILIF